MQTGFVEKVPSTNIIMLPLFSVQRTVKYHEATAIKYFLPYIDTRWLLLVFLLTDKWNIMIDRVASNFNVIELVNDENFVLIYF